MSVSSASASVHLGEEFMNVEKSPNLVAEVKESNDAGPLPSSPHAQQRLSGWRLASVIAGITLACFLMLLDVSIVVTAVPVITNDFNSLPQIGWYGAAYQLGSAALQPLAGKFYTNFSTKWTFVAFFLLFELGSLLCGIAVSSNMLIVGRAVAGIGTAGIQSGSLIIVAGCVPMPQRPPLIGLIIGVAQFGLVIGPVIGGVLTEYATWRWCFFINLPCAAVVGALVLFIHIPEQMPKQEPLLVLRKLHHKMDLFGFILFAPACIMLLFAVQLGGNQYAWDSSTVIGLFVGAGVNGLVWLTWNWYKGDEAMIPMSMVTKQSVWSSCLTYSLLTSAMFCTSFYLPVYFQAVKGASPTLSGVYLLPSVISQLIATIAGGKLLGKLGYYLPFAIISAVLTSVGYGLLSTLCANTSTGEWVGYQILFGFGRGLGIQIPLIAVQNSLPPAMIPVGLALTIFGSTFGGALFLSFSDTIFINSLRCLISSQQLQVSAGLLIAAGATGFRRLVSGEDLAVVLDAYSKSVNRVFYMIAALSVMCFLTSFGLGWKDIRRNAPSAAKV